MMEFIRFLVSVFWRVETRTPSYFQNELMPDTSPLGPDLTPQPMWQKARQQIEALQRIDPDFNEFAFMDYAARAYVQAMSAEGAMDPSGARDVVSPDYAARLAARIDAWKSQGFRRVISGLKLDGTTLFKVALDGISESLVVRISGSSVRYTLDTSSGVAADGGIQIEMFTEFATFVRPTGTVTPKTAQLGGPTHCPSCGAPAPMSATKCAFCNTPLTPSGAPWLLEHVSQSAYT
jgi:predicted lipid-binding transport protein (Tim44 family)